MTALLDALDQAPSHFGGSRGLPQIGEILALRSVCDTGDDAQSKFKHISDCPVEEVGRRTLPVQLASSDISANTSLR